MEEFTQIGWRCVNIIEDKSTDYARFRMLVDNIGKFPSLLKIVLDGPVFEHVDVEDLMKLSPVKKVVFICGANQKLFQLLN